MRLIFMAWLCSSAGAAAGRADINDIDAVRAAVMGSRKPGQTGRYFIEG